VKRTAWLTVALLPIAHAHASPMLDALRAHDWTAAETLAAQAADPLQPKLVTFIRLLQPGLASTAELDRFLTENPAWPEQRTLTKRLEEALATEQDTQIANRVCATRPIENIPALLHCADSAGHPKGAVYAKKAWVQGIDDITGQTDFLRRWADVLTPDDDWRRFDTLAWANDKAAASQTARLDADHLAAAQARLALRHDDNQALILLDHVPQKLRGDPTLLLEEARYLRRGNADSAAVALWRAVGPTAEATAPTARRAAFWTERDILSRKLLIENNPGDARDIAADTSAAPDQLAESLFLSGWIALRRQNNPTYAATAFNALLPSAHSAIARARAHYWLARAAEAAGDGTHAHTDYAAAAAFPTTYYGQLAARALNTSPALPPDPVWTGQQAVAFTGTELVRAADILASWGDSPRARGFLAASVRTATDPAIFALAAHLAMDLGLPDTAVLIARLAGRQAIMLPQAGWPEPYHPDSDIASLVLGIMRQESSFDPGATSPAGAIGLMQMLPNTAAETAHGGARPGGRPNLLDAATNMRLGTAYVQKLLGAFGGDVPETLAAYNAGPRHAHAWQAANGDPATEADAIDWIEMIPYSETRTYVQRVIENAVLYARKTGTAFDPFTHKKS
jgi:soluble lytic murein transglycosylase